MARSRSASAVTTAAAPVRRAKRPDLAGDPRFRTNPDRVANREALVALLAAHFRTALRQRVDPAHCRSGRAGRARAHRAGSAGKRAGGRRGGWSRAGDAPGDRRAAARRHPVQVLCYAGEHQAAAAAPGRAHGGGGSGERGGLRPGPGPATPGRRLLAPGHQPVRQTNRTRTAPWQRASAPAWTAPAAWNAGAAHRERQSRDASAAAAPAPSPGWTPRPARRTQRRVHAHRLSQRLQSRPLRQQEDRARAPALEHRDVHPVTLATRASSSTAITPSWRLACERLRHAVRELHPRCRVLASLRLAGQVPFQRL